MSMRSGRLFLEHSTGELHQLQRVQLMMFMMVSASWSIRRLRALAGGAPVDPADADIGCAGFLPEDFACLGVATFAALAAVVPRTRVSAPRRRHLRLGDVDNVTFRSRYRFRQEHVWLLLEHLCLLDANGMPSFLCVGDGMQLVWADTALLVLLRCMVMTEQWDYLVQVNLQCSDLCYRLTAVALGAGDEHEQEPTLVELAVDG